MPSSLPPPHPQPATAAVAAAECVDGVDDLDDRVAWLDLGSVTPRCSDSHDMWVLRLLREGRLFSPGSSLPGRRRLRSSFTLQLHVPPYRLSTAGPSLVSCRSLHFVKHSARRRAVCTVCLFLPATSKDILVSPVISGHHSLFLYYILVDFATV